MLATTTNGSGDSISSPSVNNNNNNAAATEHQRRDSLLDTPSMSVVTDLNALSASPSAAAAAAGGANNASSPTPVPAITTRSQNGSSSESHKAPATPASRSVSISGVPMPDDTTELHSPSANGADNDSGSLSPVSTRFVKMRPHTLGAAVPSGSLHDYSGVFEGIKSSPSAPLRSMTFALERPSAAMTGGSSNGATTPQYTLLSDVKLDDIIAIFHIRVPSTLGDDRVEECIISSKEVSTIRELKSKCLEEKRRLHPEVVPEKYMNAHVRIAGSAVHFEDHHPTQFLCKKLPPTIDGM